MKSRHKHGELTNAGLKGLTKEKNDYPSVPRGDGSKVRHEGKDRRAEEEKILKIKTSLANLRVGRIESIPPIRAESKSQIGEKKIKIWFNKNRKGKEETTKARSQGRLRGKVHRQSAQRGAVDEQERQVRSKEIF